MNRKLYEEDIHNIGEWVTEGQAAIGALLGEFTLLGDTEELVKLTTELARVLFDIQQAVSGAEALPDDEPSEQAAQ